MLYELYDIYKTNSLPKPIITLMWQDTYEVLVKRAKKLYLPTDDTMMTLDMKKDEALLALVDKCMGSTPPSSSAKVTKIGFAGNATNEELAEIYTPVGFRRYIYKYKTMD